MLDGAIAQMQAWTRDPAIASAPSVSVNLSVRQLADPQLTARLAEILEAHAADPGGLLLEVTESVILDDVETGLAVLNQLTAPRSTARSLPPSTIPGHTRS